MIIEKPIFYRFVSYEFRKGCCTRYYKRTVAETFCGLLFFFGIAWASCLICWCCSYPLTVSHPQPPLRLVRPILCHSREQTRLKVSDPPARDHARRSFQTSLYSMSLRTTPSAWPTPAELTEEPVACCGAAHLTSANLLSIFIKRSVDERYDKTSIAYHNNVLRCRGLQE
jgi:hypothetical protein